MKLIVQPHLARQYCFLNGALSVLSCERRKVISSSRLIQKQDQHARRQYVRRTAEFTFPRSFLRDTPAPPAALSRADIILKKEADQSCQ